MSKPVIPFYIRGNFHLDCNLSSILAVVEPVIVSSLPHTLKRMVKHTLSQKKYHSTDGSDLYQI